MDQPNEVTIVLEPRKEKALAMIFEGCTDTEIARILEISRMTLYRWRMNDERFIQALKERRALLKQQAREGLMDMTGSALNAVLESLNCRDPRVRLQAARYVLEHFGLQNEPEKGEPSVLDYLYEALSGMDEELGIDNRTGLIMK